MREAIAGRLVAGASVDRQYDDVVPGLTLIRLPKGVSVTEATQRFGLCADVLYVEPNYRYQLHKVPNDPNFVKQWALNNTGQSGGKKGADIHAENAWDSNTGLQSLLVAILDTGVDLTHEDLKANIWKNPLEASGKAKTDDDGNGKVDDLNGWNFLTDKPDVTDDVYHGTYVAGIIGAAGNNGLGITGVNWNISMMICKVADKNGVKVSAAVAAVQYATACGAKVINASWGDPNYSQSLQDAIAAAGKKGVLFVASAGNGSINNDKVPIYPASYPLGQCHFGHGHRLQRPYRVAVELRSQDGAPRGARPERSEHDADDRDGAHDERRRDGEIRDPDRHVRRGAARHGGGGPAVVEVPVPVGLPHQARPDADGG